jgi:membrane protease YdiL (CAAX protease family)
MISEDAMRPAVTTPYAVPWWQTPAARDGAAVLVYFSLHLAYLFITLESELGHWVTLVALPLGLIYLSMPAGPPRFRLAAALRSVGLAAGRLRSGLGWALVIGLVLGALQVVVSARRAAVWELLQSGQALYLLPLTFALMMVTAAFTEEFFFRGVLQSRLSRWLGKVPGLLIASLLFGLYHLPYAYLSPRWPSHGDMAAALSAALGQGIIGGLILGTVYARARGNLLAPVLVHALINAVPAMVLIDTMLKR